MSRNDPLGSSGAGAMTPDASELDEPTSGSGGVGGSTAWVGGAGTTSGEAGAAGGDAGAPVDVCGVPIPQLAAWRPRNERRTNVATLAAARLTFVGTWHGIRTTPWESPRSVDLKLEDHGSYSAHCEGNSAHPPPDVESTCCAAFYYGSDHDSPLKTWSLDSVNDDGTVNGTINIAFRSYGDQNTFYLPTWQGELKNLDYDQTGNRLRFEFWTSDGHGPVSFDLARTSY